MMISINSSFLHEWRTGAKKSILPTLSMVILLVCLVWIGMGRDIVQAQGTEEWIARYDAPPGNCLGCNYDYPIAIAVDGNGNVYVTGYVAMNNSGYTTTVDYATVKYDASGNQVWVARYNGPGNKQDKPTALAVDGNGNVYVTGWSYGSFSDVDYATIKYDTNGNQLWVARYNYYYQDEAYALAVDAAGNVYVTGRSIDCCSGSGSGSATVKYDTNGNQLWVAHGPSSSGDATALAVDATGNVYVTGGIGTGYGTIKYDASGNQLWVATYNGPGNSDTPVALSVDSYGNTYVTGYSYYGSGYNYDYATVKYDPNGSQLWVARYNGPVNLDMATALAVDGSGNVYVTGRSEGSSPGYDYATVKYDANGNQVWVARFNQPGDGGWDTATALAVDGSGNVYVTGTTVFSSYNQDYATVKYDSNGNQVWLARYNGPDNMDDNATALAVDAAGNVYVTGNSEGSATHDDYVTIKYSAYSTTGSDLSITIADSPDSVTFVGESIVYTMTVTNNGPGDYSSVTVTDTLASTVSLLSATTSQGTCSGTTTITCNLGYLAGGQSANIAIAVLTTTAGMINNMASVAGDQADTDTSNNSATENTTVAIAQVEEVWGARYSGSAASSDYATAVAVDGSGSVYVTGYGNSEYATVKYDASGNQVWVANYNGPCCGLVGKATALVVDGNGNVYVTGAIAFTSSDYEYVTIKYDTNGNQVWVARYSGAAGVIDYMRDVPAALAVDGSGNVYVTGRIYLNDNDHDYATIKYDSNGNQRWVRRYSGPGYSPYSWDEPVALAVDGNGNVYVTGNSQGSNDFYDYDYATIKYSSNGNLLWVARHNGPGNKNDNATALAVDVAGNVYVTGSIFFYDGINVYGSTDYATIKYSSNGNQLWVAQYNGPGNGADKATALAIDGNGNVYVTGNSVSLGSSYKSDYATIKYDTNGNQLWVGLYNGPGNDEDKATALAVDVAGNVYVTGSTYITDTDTGYATVKYDASGNWVWVARYNGPWYSYSWYEEPVGLAVDGNGNVYVAGYSYGLDTYSDYVTIKYSQASIQDADDDGYSSDIDCNDNNPSVYPGATEVCNALDDNCNGATDEGCANNTPSGTNVDVSPTPDTTLIFDTVTTSGTTTVATSGTGQPPPSGYRMGSPPIYYDISTTATYSGLIHVCFSYDETQFTTEQNLRLFHLEGGAWVNITDPGYPDTINNIICGTTSSLSPFIIAEEGSSPPLINISTRGMVQTGDSVMIGGFIISGTGPRSVLIRGFGPTLADFGVTGAMSNPYIELYSGQTLIATNDNWQTPITQCDAPAVSCGTPQDIQATGKDACTVATTGCSQDAAILVTLPPGAYTAIMRGVGGGTGVGLIGVDDNDTSSLSKLVNISTRGKVLTGDSVMIGGFIVGGSASKTVLIRGFGPTLADFGVTGALANPYVELYSGQTMIATNDNWQTQIALCDAPAVSCGTPIDIQATGKDACTVATTGCGQDAAILVTLPPGAYTAIVRGVGGVTGVGLVGIDEIGP